MKLGREEGGETGGWRDRRVVREEGGEERRLLQLSAPGMGQDKPRQAAPPPASDFIPHAAVWHLGFSLKSKCRNRCVFPLRKIRFNLQRIFSEEEEKEDPLASIKRHATKNLEIVIFEKDH